VHGFKLNIQYCFGELIVYYVNTVLKFQPVKFYNSLNKKKFWVILKVNQYLIPLGYL